MAETSVLAVSQLFLSARASRPPPSSKMRIISMTTLMMQCSQCAQTMRVMNCSVVLLPTRWWPLIIRRLRRSTYPLHLFLVLLPSVIFVVWYTLHCEVSKLTNNCNLYCLMSERPSKFNANDSRFPRASACLPR